MRNFQAIFPGLSRTKVLFQDFPGPGIFMKKIQDFPGGVGTLVPNGGVQHENRRAAMFVNED